MSSTGEVGNSRARGGRIRIAPRRALAMAASYAGDRLGAQAKAVAFVLVYLLAAQLLVFKVPLREAASVALGVAATIAGLAFFLEGLFLGIMPLGEQCGLRLPAKAGPLALAALCVVLGVTATFAEPAIGALKTQGGSVAAWEAPLLFTLLNRGSGWLIAAVAAGVGLAVMLGTLRFLYGWAFKPAVYLIMPVLVAVGFLFEGDALLRPVAGLAWDTGGITTGPVTVPLVIALGVGISRITGERRGGASGLGVVTLASALPVAAVFILALLLRPLVPAAGGAASFFDPGADTRRKAEFVAGGPEALESLGRSALAKGALSAEDYDRAFRHAASAGRGSRTEAATGESGPPSSRAGTLSSLRAQAVTALAAVLPLALVLGLTLVVLLRERLRNADEIALGLAFAVVGMFLFGLGMERGLSALGNQAGLSLPRAYEERAREDQALVLAGVDESSIFSAAGPEGPAEYVWMRGPEGPVALPFDRSAWDEGRGLYRYVPVERAVFGRWGFAGGLAAVLAFVFVLGFGATLAEPSLAALGATVEEITTGTYRRSTLVGTVAIGVGIGMAFGFARILLDLPLAWILGGAYALALVLTIFSSEEFAAIAWDAAGVTTGPVTVPLVIAAGLGIGSKAGASGAFGVLAAASVFPVISVLLSGILVRAKARRGLSPEAAGRGRP